MDYELQTRDYGPKNYLRPSLFISFTLHALLLGSLVFLLQSDSIEKAAGIGDVGAIYIELVGTTSTTKAKPLDEGEEVSVEKSISDPANSLSGYKHFSGGELSDRFGSAQNGSRLFSTDTSSPSTGESRNGGEGGTSQILRQIRNKIERNKFYPLLAKRSRVEGSPRVEFKIKNDGTLEYVVLKKSSGSKILDNAATQTVNQAAPYPFYPEPISLNIHYGLTY